MSVNNDKPRGLRGFIKDLEDKEWALRPDPDLRRYNKDSLFSYIGSSCYTNNYIEAYTLTLQYVDEILLLPFNEEKESFSQKSAPIFVKQFTTTGYLDNGYYAKYKEVKKTRNELAHKVLFEKDVKGYLQKMKPKKHAERLQNLIESTESFIIRFASENTGLFTPYGKTKSGKYRIAEKNNLFRFQRMLDVLLNRTTRDMDGYFEATEFNEDEYRKKFLEVLNGYLLKTTNYMIEDSTV